MMEPRNDTPPPPYSAASSQSDDQPISDPDPSTKEPQELSGWQKRWNREWLNNAVIPDLRWRYLLFERPSSRTGVFTTKQLKSRREKGAECVSRHIQEGCADKDNDMTRTRWQYVTDRLFWPLKHLKHDYDEFKKWRHDYKNKDRLWQVTAVMEDIGDDPKWQAEMTFKIHKGQWSQFKHEGQWLEFPSPENIKWFWVTRPDGHRRVVGPAAENWGPATKPPLTVVMPFYQAQPHGQVMRSPKVGDPKTGHYWRNFGEPQTR